MYPNLKKKKRERKEGRKVKKKKKRQSEYFYDFLDDKSSVTSGIRFLSKSWKSGNDLS